MDAAVLHALGKVPRFEQFAEPAPGKDEVLVHVRAASLKPVDKQMANGSHYASPRALPAVCGIDGVGRLADGSLVYFAGPRSPYGAMAQRTVVANARCFQVPLGIDETTAAAVVNPGVSSWLTLTWRARLAAGESVLILGATGVTGRLAVQIAKLLGAGRVIAAGRNEKILSTLRGLGADATIPLDTPDPELTAAFAREAGGLGFNVIVDYLWGRPTEALLAALMRREFAVATSEMRLIEVGESAGANISLPAAVLRSAPLTLLGTAGIPTLDVLTDAYQQVMARAVCGQLRIETERVRLADIEDAWQRELHGRRLVVIP